MESIPRIQPRLTRQPVAGHFYRRYGIPASIGVIHAYFLWYSDILFSDALAALTVFLIYRRVS